MVKLTDKQRAELEALEAMPEDQIDFSDIPEMTDADWATARRGVLYRPDWQQITLRLDQNIVDWFEENAETPQAAHEEINRVLAEHMRQARLTRTNLAEEAAG